MGMAVGLSLLMAGMQAQISLPSVFADHMVLQQKSEVPYGDGEMPVRQ